MPLFGKSTKKYKFESQQDFNLALQFYNRRWEKPTKAGQKVVENQAVFVEKMYIRTRGQFACSTCDGNFDAVTSSGHAALPDEQKWAANAMGGKYYENQNKPQTKLCYECMGYKLKKEVGTDGRRLAQELQWLNTVHNTHTTHRDVIYG